MRVEVIDDKTFSTAAEMRAHYAAVRRRTDRRAPPVRTSAPVVEIEEVASEEVASKEATSTLPCSVSECVTEAARVSRQIGEMTVAAVSIYFRVDVTDIVGESRLQQLVYVRRIATYVFKAVADPTYFTMGRLLRRDHATLISSLRKSRGRRQGDDVYRALTDEFVRHITKAAEAKGWSTKHILRWRTRHGKKNSSDGAGGKPARGAWPQPPAGREIARDPA